MSIVPTTESAAQRVYGWVRACILDGTYAGGTLLVEGDVATAVGVSRTPVREAFLQLAAEEMLTLYPKRGALVMTVSLAELRDVIAARLVVEPWAISAVVERSNRKEIVDGLRRYVDDMAGALAASDDADFQESDRAFHQHLINSAGNRLLASFYSTLRDKQIRSFSLALRHHPERGPEILAQHVAITDAIDAGDVACATGLITAHIVETKRALSLA